MEYNTCNILEQNDKIPLEVKCENLINWLKNGDSKFKISDNLKIQKDQYDGIGLFYENLNQSMEDILYIPSTFLINKLTCINFFKNKLIEHNIWNEIFNKHINVNEVETSWNSFLVIILYMYIEWFCLKEDDSCFHLPFFQSLPSHKFFEENIPVLQYLQLIDLNEIETAEKIKANLNIEFENEFLKLLKNIEFAEETLLPIFKNFEGNVFLIKKRIRYLYMCINSRCLYYEIKRNNPVKEDNLTLVPLVDFINHENNESKYNSFVEVTSNINLSKQDYKLHVKKENLKSGMNQLLFKYGPHNDCLLLNDYGFILNGENDNNYLDVTDIIMNELKPWEIEYLKQIHYYKNDDQFLINSDKQTPFFNTQLAIFVISLNLDFPNLARLKQFAKPKQMRLTNYIKNMQGTKNYEQTLRNVIGKYNENIDHKLNTLKSLPKCPSSIISLMEKYYIHE